MNHAIAAGFAAAYYIVTFALVGRMRFSARILSLCSITAAMTLVLESIRFPLPTGATISLLSPIPLMVLALVAGFRPAVVTGWVCGILVMLLVPGWQPIHWGQFFVEHMVCFSCLGYTGLWGSDKKHRILWGIVLACVLKFTGHLLAGVVFFSQNAWSGWGAWGYSFLYNLSQNLPLCILSGIIVMLLPLNTLKAAADGR